MTSKVFPLAVVVSVVQDRLLCPFAEYRELLSFMVGRDLYLWEVATARRTCAERLVRTFPELATIPNVPEKTDSGNANKHVRACSKALGGVDSYTLAPKTVKLAQRTLSEAL